MKIKKRSLTPPNPVKVVIYREPENFTFFCHPVLDYSEFEKLCPEPTPPLVTTISTGQQTPDPNDKRYRNALEKWATLKRDWLIIQSLRGTEELEWETVDYNDPNTWSHYEEELSKVLTTQEYNKLLTGCYSANNPSEKSLSEARESFSVTQEEPEGQSTVIQTEEATNTPSGVPASV